MTRVLRQRAKLRVRGLRLLLESFEEGLGTRLECARNRQVQAVDPSPDDRRPVPSPGLLLLGAVLLGGAPDPPAAAASGGLPLGDPCASDSFPSSIDSAPCRSNTERTLDARTENSDRQNRPFYSLAFFRKIRIKSRTFFAASPPTSVCSFKSFVINLIARWVTSHSSAFASSRTRTMKRNSLYFRRFLGGAAALRRLASVDGSPDNWPSAMARSLANNRK